jgi:hypothetical protein
LDSERFTRRFFRRLSVDVNVPSHCVERHKRFLSGKSELNSEKNETVSGKNELLSVKPGFHPAAVLPAAVLPAAVLSASERLSIPRKLYGTVRLMSCLLSEQWRGFLLSRRYQFG